LCLESISKFDVIDKRSVSVGTAPRGEAVCPHVMFFSGEAPVCVFPGEAPVLPVLARAAPVPDILSTIPRQVVIIFR
jgi:hypothetical protein